MIVQECLGGLKVVVPYIASLSEGLAHFQNALLHRMVASAYGKEISARFMNAASKQRLEDFLLKMNTGLKQVAPGLPSENSTPAEYEELTDILKLLMLDIRGEAQGRNVMEQGRFEAQAVCYRSVSQPVSQSFSQSVSQSVSLSVSK